jgi:nitrous oxidase accessory protein NosD
MALWRRAGLPLFLTAAAVLVLGSGCSANGTVSLDAGTPDGGYDTVCGPNLKPYGPTCVPILDDCPDNHVPIPGGGCKRVGVEECSVDGVAGIKGPPDWTCKRIGVVECKTADGGPGIKGPPDWTCKAIGPPTKCLTGWAKGADGWCEPILPKTKCPAGMMEVIGKTTCQPVGDCGTGKWGNIVLTAKTLFVDASYVGKDADGSQIKPFATIGQALKAAPRDAHVVVAEGEYKEDLVLDKALVLEGRCAAKVRVVGQDPKAAAVTVLDTATIRGLGITGPGRGIWLKAARARVEEVEVARCGDTGVEVQGASKDPLRGPELTLRDSLVASNHARGMHISSAAALVERSVVRDTQPRATDKTQGSGIVAHSEQGQPGELVLRDSLVARNHRGGVVAYGGTATIERSVVRDTRAQASENGSGVGIMVRLYKGVPATLQLTDSLVDNNRLVGVGVYSADATIQRSIVRDTQKGLEPTQQFWIGTGIEVYGQTRHTLLVQDALVAGNHYIGLSIFENADATVERSVIRDTLPTNGDWGPGVFSYSPLTLRDSLVANNHALGVHVWGAKAVVERSVVRDTQPRTLDETRGHGITAVPEEGQPASLELRDSLVARNRTIGVGVAGKAVLERSVVQDTQPTASNNGYGKGIQVESQNNLPAELQLTECLVRNNRFIGVAAFNANATIQRSIVRDTQNGLSPATEDHPVCWIGTGIMASHNEQHELLVQDSLVAANHFAGLVIFDTDATVERCVVRDNRPNKDGTWGFGVYDAGMSIPSKLSLADSVVSHNRVAGVVVSSASALVQRCRVEGTLPGKAVVLPAGYTTPVTWEGWGEGLWVSGATESPYTTALDLQDSLIEASARSGLFFYHSRGSIHRTVLRKGVFSVVLDNAQVELGDDNLFVDNTENRVTYEDLAQLAPIPIPPPPSLGNP